MCDRKEEIIAYFNRLDRRHYVEQDQSAAASDRPLPIGCGQTISQPSLVLNMTLALHPQSDSQVLEVGTGSGYQTAMLAAFSRVVYTVERIETLYHKAKKHLHAEGFDNIHFRLGDGSLGWHEHQPYDRIMVTASVSRIPEELVAQLDTGGRMVIPVGDARSQQLKVLEKEADGEITTSVLEDVAFVRLIGKYE